MTTLAQYSAARAAIAEAIRIDQVMHIREEIAHASLHAKQVKDRALIADAMELQILAERRLGELLIAAKEAGQIAEGRRKKNCDTMEQFPRVTLDEAGIDRKLSSKAQGYAKLSERALQARIQEARDWITSRSAVIVKTADKKERRDQRERDLAGKIEKAADTLSTGKRYGVILADPPWRFEPYSRETGMDRAPENHYPTMTVEEIKALPVPAAVDCVLFLWATAPMLPEALAVMEAWGFIYKSHAVWVKDKVGTGYWFRSQHELLLVGTKGSVPAPAPGTQIESVFHQPVGKHSEKPPTAHILIEDIFPNLPKLEMFSRQAAHTDGWTVWGAEADAVEIVNPDTGEITTITNCEEDQDGFGSASAPAASQPEPAPRRSRGAAAEQAGDWAEPPAAAPSSGEELAISSPQTITTEPAAKIGQAAAGEGSDIVVGVDVPVPHGDASPNLSDPGEPLPGQGLDAAPRSASGPDFSQDPAPETTPIEGEAAASVSGKGTPASPSNPSTDTEILTSSGAKMPDLPPIFDRRGRA